MARALPAILALGLSCHLLAHSTSVRILLPPGLALPADLPGVVITQQQGRVLHATVSDGAMTLLHRIGCQVDPLSGPRVYEQASYASVVQELEQLAEDHPDLCQLYSIGKSNLDRDLWVLQISDRPLVEENEPEIKLVSTIHGDERTATEMAMRLIHHLIDSYGADDDITALVDHTDIHILPIMNPDGFEANSRWNSHTVDLNRNFPSPFHTPTVEIENQAVIAWTMDRHFALSGGLHSGAIGVIYPWGHSHSHASESVQFPETSLARELSLHYTAFNSLMLAQDGFNANYGGIWTDGTINGAAWFAINGEMADWNYRFAGCLELTIEFSLIKTPDADGMNLAWEQNAEALLAFLKMTHRGIRGTVHSSLTQAPLAAKIYVWNKAAATPTISMSTGWNLVALPTVPVNPSPDQIFPSASGVWAYDPLGRSYLEPTAVRPGLAYWVYQEHPTSLDLPGLSLAAHPVTIRTGWNLTGLQDANALDAAGIIASYATDASGAHAPIPEELDPLSAQWVLAGRPVSIPLSSPAINPPLASRSDATNSHGDFHRVTEPGHYVVSIVSDTTPALSDRTLVLSAVSPELLVDAQLPHNSTTFWHITVPDELQENGLPANTSIQAKLSPTASCYVRWQINGGPWEEAEMIPTRQQFRLALPQQLPATSVNYVFELRQHGSNAVLLRSPETGTHSKVTQ